ncbi:MAG TPA: nucleotidyltransferase family protein [Candidatus Cybelea sp.]|nr:nucleotidyltransferase family protein [Candidatus Cybelea sp.]
MLNTAADILRLIEADTWRMGVLRVAMTLNLPDCWIGAGFVRNLIWDELHGYEERTPLNDVDVIWFDRREPSAEKDDVLVAKLKASWPDVPWSVLNMARMHLPAGDPPYASSIDGVRFWPETATAVAVRCNSDRSLELAAPLGLSDLLDLRVRPTPSARERHPDAYRGRIAKKNWLRRWPRLRIETI